VIDALQARTAFRRPAGARGVNEDASHDSRRDREEAGAILPVHSSSIDQRHEGIVHQRGRIEARTR
jgi:hypothetical protein